MGLQFWQLSLVNDFARAALYRRVRVLKTLAFGGALFLGLQQKWDLEKKWTYLNRVYPEPTELQKTLYRDAMMFKEHAFEPKPIEERIQIDADTTKVYEQLYRLPPQTTGEPDEDPNPPSIKTHY